MFTHRTLSDSLIGIDVDNYAFSIGRPGFTNLSRSSLVAHLGNLNPFPYLNHLFLSMYTLEYTPNIIICQQGMSADTILPVTPYLSLILSKVHIPKPVGFCSVLIFLLYKLSKISGQVPPSCIKPIFFGS